ncbi:MAG: hypothetical protein LBE10_08380 [Treponema sp.]|jgi:hypothetical protein|nr:hypothetical protein [Treponema sp.]
MYHIAMTRWIAGNEDIETSCMRLKKYGYNGIEFAAEPGRLDPDTLWTDTPNRLSTISG